MIIRKEWAMPNKNTFLIKPIKNLLNKYWGNASVIIDPFANNSKIGTITNDLNPEYDTTYHLDALDFLGIQPDNSADLILFDPPYSLTQAIECYNSYGKEKLKYSVANMKYWKLCKDECARILKIGGKIISFGWNTNGLGKQRGFEPVEILIVSHGGSKNDTLCTVETKIMEQKSVFEK